MQLIAIQLCCVWRHKIPPLNKFKLRRRICWANNLVCPCQWYSKSRGWLGELSHCLQSFADQIVAFPRPFRPDSRTAQDVFIRVFWGIRDAFLFSSSSPSTIAIILRCAEVSLDLSVLPMLKLGSNTFAKKNFVSEKKLFFALYELHDNMKAWTDYWIIEHVDKMIKNNWTKNAKQPP